MIGAGGLFPDGQVREQAEPLIYGEEPRKFSVSPKPMSSNTAQGVEARAPQIDAYGTDIRTIRGLSREPRDPVTNLRAYSPNAANKGIKVTTINNPANGHGIGVSYSNVHFSYI
jgi:hypothetical protein